MSGPIEKLYRYPFKGLSPELLSSVALLAGKGFPMDRAWAITNGVAQVDRLHPKPMPKTDFLMLMLHERLAVLRTRFDDAGAVLHVEGDEVDAFSASLETAGGREQVEAFFTDYLWDAVGDGKPEVVSRPGHRFTDVSVVSESMMNAVSLINLKTVLALEAATGSPTDPLRFRANIYFDGERPWEEFDWLGRDIMIGDARAKVVLRTQRCPATSVNPATAIRDRDVPAEIEQHFGHRDLGIYAELQTGGVITPGAMVRPA